MKESLTILMESKVRTREYYIALTAGIAFKRIFFQLRDFIRKMR